MELFDLHCDTLTALCGNKGSSLLRNDFHISLERVASLRRYAQFFAIWSPAEGSDEDAHKNYTALLECFRRQLELFSDKIVQCRTAAELTAAFESGKTAALLSIESARCCMGSTEILREMYGDGVRMLSLCWNERNSLADGAGVEEGGGLTALGRSFVSEAERLGMVLDVSHLADAGFWDVCECAALPFVASHSNSRAVCQNRRNLTDEMFGELVRRGGLVGINFYSAFLCDARHSACADSVVRHVDRFMSLGGQKIVCIGADFDGATVPDDIAGPDRVEAVAEALLRANYSESLVRDILFDNTLRFFAERL